MGVSPVAPSGDAFPGPGGNAVRMGRVAEEPLDVGKHIRIQALPARVLASGGCSALSRGGRIALAADRSGDPLPSARWATSPPEREFKHPGVFRKSGDEP